MVVSPCSQEVPHISAVTLPTSDGVRASIRHLLQPQVCSGSLRFLDWTCRKELAPLQATSGHSEATGPAPMERGSCGPGCRPPFLTSPSREKAPVVGCGQHLVNSKLQGGGRCPVCCLDRGRWAWHGVRCAGGDRRRRVWEPGRLWAGVGGGCLGGGGDGPSPRPARSPQPRGAAWWVPSG